MRLSIIAFAALVALLAATPADAKPSSTSARPAAICSSPVHLVTSAATKTVGKGTPASCNEAALVSALAKGGVIHFNCGPKPVTIAINSEIKVNPSVNTVIDGNHLVTLDGKGVTRIMSLNTGNYNSVTPTLTVQRLRFINGHSQGSGTNTSNGGGALYRIGGSFDVIDSDFGHNKAPSPGQDIAGGAIYSIGGGFTRISGSIFYANEASNGGGIGNLGNDLSIYNSWIGYNKATGTGGNPGDGGNGGGICMDGKGRTATLCGVAIVNNVANKFGGAMFRTSYTGLEPNNFDHILVDGNQIVESGGGLAGGLYIQGGKVVLTNSAVTRNKAGGYAGIFLAPMDHENSFKNVVIAENTAYTGLGGGIDCDSDVTGTFDHITVARNHAPGTYAFGGGITGCTGITLSNSAVVDNTEGNMWNPLNCFGGPLKEGGNNVQGPKVRASGQTDPSCTSNSAFIPGGSSSKLNTHTFCVTVKGGHGAQCMSKIPGLGGKVPNF